MSPFLPVVSRHPFVAAVDTAIANITIYRCIERTDGAIGRGSANGRPGTVRPSFNEFSP